MSLIVHWKVVTFAKWVSLFSNEEFRIENFDCDFSQTLQAEDEMEI